LWEFAIDGPDSFDMFVCNDLPDMKIVEEDWIPILREASQWEGQKRCPELYYICAKCLLRNDPDWDGLPVLLGRLLHASQGYNSLSLIAKYSQNAKWVLPPELRAAVRETHRSFGPWRKLLCRIDDLVYRLVELSKGE
jgi:hypothetical protein